MLALPCEHWHRADALADLGGDIRQGGIDFAAIKDRHSEIPARWFSISSVTSHCSFWKMVAISLPLMLLRYAYRSSRPVAIACHHARINASRRVSSCGRALVIQCGVLTPRSKRALASGYCGGQCDMSTAGTV